MAAATLALVLGATSAAMSAVGAIQQGNAAAASAKADAQMAHYNEVQSRQQAAAELRAAAAEEVAQRRIARRQIAAQAAMSGSTGLELAGSSMLSLENSATAAEMDALNIRYAGGERARAAVAGANLAGYERQVANQNARTARTAGLIGGGAALLGGLGSTVGTYYGQRPAVKSGVRV